MRLFLLSMSILGGLAAAALAADRPVTEAERASLTAALSAQGCSGGKMQFDDGKFEVEDARCADGKTYDLDFDAGFKLIRKKVDN